MIKFRDKIFIKQSRELIEIDGLSFTEVKSGNFAVCFHLRDGRSFWEKDVILVRFTGAVSCYGGKKRPIYEYDVVSGVYTEDNDYSLVYFSNSDLNFLMRSEWDLDRTFTVAEVGDVEIVGSLFEVSKSVWEQLEVFKSVKEYKSYLTK